MHVIRATSVTTRAKESILALALLCLLAKPLFQPRSHLQVSPSFMYVHFNLDDPTTQTLSD